MAKPPVPSTPSFPVGQSVQFVPGVGNPEIGRTSSEPAALSTSERLVDAYKRLAASAEILNVVSDEFAKPIVELDDALQKLNLGIETWLKVSGDQDDDNFWRRDVGYIKLAGKWGLAIRKTVGDLTDPETNDSESWLFNDAPRSYRIEALDALPELLEQLIKSTDKAAKKIKAKTIEAQQLAMALSAAATEVTTERKERR